jgi:curved DNA-binding protein CbpA
MATRPSDQNFYDLLEVPRGAPHHEIVAAYQRAKEAYAPDSPALYTMFSKEEAAELRKLVDEAFLVLGNQTKRKEYDIILLAREGRLETSIDHRQTGLAQQQNSQPLPDFIPQAATEPSSRNSNTSSKMADLRPPTLAGNQAASTAAFSGTLPAGFARSKLSVYEVKSEMEQEIVEQKNFDGPFLRKVRQYKGINIDQLSKETRISRSYLAAVEGDDFEALPAPVFVRGFIVQVARILGLDENLVATSYMGRLGKKK